MIPPATPHVRRLAAELFEDLHRLTQRLLAVLEHEAALLSARRHGELEANSQEKRVVAADLEKALAGQRALLRSFDCPDTPDGMQRLLARLDTEPGAVSELRARWDEIRTLSKRCQLLNQRNGASIELFRRHFQRAVRILHGQIDAAPTYGPDGSEQTRLTPLSRVSV